MSTPTPSKLGDKKESEENTAETSDDSSYSTNSLPETTTAQSSATSLNPTSIKNIEDTQTVLQNKPSSTITPGRGNTDNEESSTKSFTEKDISVTDNLEPILQPSIGTSSSTKRLETTTTESSGMGKTNNNGAQPRRDDSVFEGNDPN